MQTELYQTQRYKASPSLTVPPVFNNGFILTVATPQIQKAREHTLTNTPLKGKPAFKRGMSMPKPSPL